MLLFTRRRCFSVILHNMKRFSIQCRKNQNRSNYSDQSQKMHATGNKRGETRASETRLVLVLRLVGRESGANFVSQSQSVVKQNQSKREITFDTQLKTTLSMRLSSFFLSL